MSFKDVRNVLYQNLDPRDIEAYKKLGDLKKKEFLLIEEYHKLLRKADEIEDDIGDNLDYSEFLDELGKDQNYKRLEKEMDNIWHKIDNNRKERQKLKDKTIKLSEIQDIGRLSVVAKQKYRRRQKSRKSRKSKRRS